MTIKSQNKSDIDQKAHHDQNLFKNDGLIQFKIVYWGPGESGKTTNFRHLRNDFPVWKLTPGYSIETTDGRTLWQDSIYLTFEFELGDTKFNVIAQIVTSTGQERFLATREYILDGADGIVFVGDSDPYKLEQNKRSFRELLGFAGPKGIPYIVQLNKRDLEDAIPMDDFKRNLGLPLIDKYEDGSPVVYPAIASEGKEVIKCFWELISQVMYEYFKSRFV